MNDACTRYPSVCVPSRLGRKFFIGKNCFHSMIGRIAATLPPMPENSLAKYMLLPVCGRWGLSMLLNEKDGISLLVITPLSASGPETLRNAICWNRSCEAVLKVVTDDVSNE